MPTDTAAWAGPRNGVYLHRDDNQPNSPVQGEIVDKVATYATASAMRVYAGATVNL